MPAPGGPRPCFVSVCGEGFQVSEFKDLSTWQTLATSPSTMQQCTTYGTSYLIFNVTTGLEYDWQAIVDDDTTRGRGYAAPAFQERNEWLDLVFSNGKLVLSSTLCYSAFDFANLPVNISSPRQPDRARGNIQRIRRCVQFRQHSTTAWSKHVRFEPKPRGSAAGEAVLGYHRGQSGPRAFHA